MTRTWKLAIAVLVACAAVACAPPPLAAPRQQPAAPLWPRTADPSVLVEGPVWWVYASDNGHHLPANPVTGPGTARGGWEWFASSHEAMPSMPAWADGWRRWAPTVAHLGGRYVMWFAADRAGAPDPANRQCVGRAFAGSPEGPFVPEPAPFSCGLDGWRGALDPQVFVDGGRVYLHLAFSGTEAPIHVVELTASGDAAARRPDGQAVYRELPVLAKRWPWEGRFIENPSMLHDVAGGRYLLAYSAGDWWTGGYSTGLATCAGPVGPCSSSPAGPWLASGNGRTGVGGLSFFTDAGGRPWAVYSSFAAGVEGEGWQRSASVSPVRLDGAPRLG